MGFDCRAEYVGRLGLGQLDGSGDDCVDGACTRLGIPAWIVVAIPATGLLVSSRLRVKPWLLEWNGVRHWLAPVSALAATLVLLFTAFTWYRATEIPRVAPAFDVAQFTQQADDRYNASAAEQIWSSANELSSQRWQTAPRYQADSLQIVREETGTAVAWGTLPLLVPAVERDALWDASALLTPALEAAVDEA